MAIKDDPAEIARHLVHEYGQEGALQEAMRHVQEAQENGRLYDLSVWREVKKFLRELRDETLS